MTHADLIAAYYPKISTFLRTKVPEPECYDLAQETMRIFLGASDRAIDNPVAYLYGIARKLTLRFYSQHRGSQPFDSTCMSVASAGGSASTRLDRRNQLLMALRTLPLDLQIAVELRFAEERSLQETADALEVSLATVKRYLDDAKGRLAIALRSANREVDERETAAIAEAYKNA